MRLKLRWARFFTLAGWHWRLSPRPDFDFHVTFPCGHSECNGSHSLLVRVSDVRSEEFGGTKFHDMFPDAYNEPHPAIFGNGPSDTYWEMPHGAGGGVATAESWTRVNANELWQRAEHE